MSESDPNKLSYTWRTKLASLIYSPIVYSLEIVSFKGKWKLIVMQYYDILAGYFKVKETLWIGEQTRN